MNQVKNLRLEKGITQQRLSMDMHVSQQYISKVENGNSSLTDDVILRLAQYFHVSIAYLLGATDDRNAEVFPGNEDLELREWIETYYELNEENKETISFLSQHLVQKQRKNRKLKNMKKE